MAFMQYLKFDNEALPLPDSYDVDLSDVEADSGGETEAGTIQRDVVRAGVVTIAVSFSISPAWLKKLTLFSKQPKISVQYFDTEELALREIEMYIEGYKAKLMKDWIVNTYSDNFFKDIFPILNGSLISQRRMYTMIVIPVYIIP